MGEKTRKELDSSIRQLLQPLREVSNRVDRMEMVKRHQFHLDIDLTGLSSGLDVYVRV